MPAISPARKVAFDVLMAIEQGQSHSDDMLRGRAVDALSPADRNLVTALVLGVLRWQIRIDHQLQALLTRPNAKLDAEILITLRLGAFQLLYLDRIPARAVVDESVELAKQAGHHFASGMVNAVLRKLDKTPPAEFPEETAAELALAQAHPVWMVERWVDTYGLEAARAICRHGQDQPAIALRIHDPAVVTELAASGLVLRPGAMLTLAYTLQFGDVTATDAFEQGRLRIQDEGSQMVGELAARALDQKETSILDACAAPGGKTLILAQRNLKARITAFESSPSRFERLRDRLAPLGDRIECCLADAAQMEDDSAYDLVLVDAPCSGTGTLGRNPEIRHRLRVEDLPRQAERQQAIFRAALRAVRPGGRVVYSTCSLEPEENEQVVAAALAEHTKARLIPIESRIDVLLREGILTNSGAKRLRGCVTREGMLKLLPGVFQTDGFFAALIERTR